MSSNDSSKSTQEQPRVCRVCKETKGISSFNKLKAAPDGLDNRCKACVSNYCKERMKNPEIAERRRLSRQTPEYRQSRRLYDSRYRATSPTYVKTKERRRLERKERYHSDAELRDRIATEHKEKYKLVKQGSIEWEARRTAHREWSRRNKERINIYSNKRRARKLSASGSFTKKDVELMMKNQKGRCWYCQKKLDKHHIEHRVPLARGGSNDPSNLVLSCPSCNLSKGAKLPHEWSDRLL